MFSYRIISNRQKTPLKPAHLKSKTELGLDGLQRQLKYLRLRVTDRVRVKGTSRFGTILHIERDPDKIKWTGSKAYFIVVQFDDKEELMTAPFQLKKVK